MTKIRNHESGPAAASKSMCGLKLTELASVVGESASTLRDWHYKNPQRFKIMCEWAQMNAKKENPMEYKHHCVTVFTTTGLTDENGNNADHLVVQYWLKSKKTGEYFSVNFNQAESLDEAKIKALVLAQELIAEDGIERTVRISLPTGSRGYSPTDRSISAAHKKAAKKLLEK